MASNEFVKDVKKPYLSIYPLPTTIDITSTVDTIIKGDGSTGTYSFSFENAQISITTPSKQIILTGENASQALSLDESGTYRINYNGKINRHYIVNGIPAGKRDYSISFYIAVVDNKLPLKKWTITDVINRLIDVAEPIRKGEKPRFRLNAEQAEKFDKILAPELSFTKQTLRECLQQVGGIIHGEPRLKPVKDENGEWIYEITYDMFGGQESSGIQYLPYDNKGQQLVIESYLGWVDSTAENLINQMDKFGGVVVEPYDGGAKSVRTENMYVRIEEGNMIIPTQYPIYTVEKLEYVTTGFNIIGLPVVKSFDITPYVFEQSEYDGRLSSYDGSFPYSKSFALHFTQGSKNISGLNFKPPAEPNAIPVFTNYAITNILREVTHNDKLELNYPTMCFRVTYTPFYTARVGQTKTNYKEFSRPAALIYNQQSNLIESRAYGENLKGAVARLGNLEMSLTYDLHFLYEIPIAGLKFNDKYYVSAVATEILPTAIKSTIGLSRDFNRLSQYIGVSSSKRYYEVSKTQAVERNTLYREFIVIGDAETPDEDSLIGEQMLNLITTLFVPTDELGPVTNVVAWGEPYSGKSDNRAVNLPVISSAFGNSISFSWTYEDNYSAGRIAQYQNNVNVEGYFQNSLPYSDYYGRFYYYNFDLQLAGRKPNVLNLLSIATSLPRGEVPNKSSGIVSTIGKTPYIMRKDSREALQVNFQIDFVTNLDNMIIGSALASYCPAVRGTDSELKPRLYVFETDLNKFTDHVEAFEAVKLADMLSVEVDAKVENGRIVISADAFPTDGKSWAIVTSQRAETTTVQGEDGEPTEQTTYYGGDLLIGKNVEVKSGQPFAAVYLTPKREVFDKTVWKDRF